MAGGGTEEAVVVRGGTATADGGGNGATEGGARLTVAPVPSEMTATTVPTGTTSPTLALISASTPAVVAGTSIEVLSVSISNRLSPGTTESPGALYHCVILPSATVSPSWGIRTSMFP